MEPEAANRRLAVGVEDVLAPSHQEVSENLEEAKPMAAAIRRTLGGCALYRGKTQKPRRRALDRPHYCSGTRGRFLDENESRRESENGRWGVRTETFR